MDGHGVGGRSERTGPTALNDASLGREIEALLAIEPSPEFLARVRTRIAEESEPDGWRLSWMVAAATITAAVIVTLLVWPSADVAPSLVATPSSHAPAEPVRVAEAGPAIAPLPVTPSQPARKPSAVNAVAAVFAPARAIDIVLPEVVLAENEVHAYTALVASVRQSRFDVTVPAPPNPNTPLEVKELPPVEPLEIEPIVRLAVLQSEGEHP